VVVVVVAAAVVVVGVVDMMRPLRLLSDRLLEAGTLIQQIVQMPEEGRISRSTAGPRVAGSHE
jgi:hypothetical protein